MKKLLFVLVALLVLGLNSSGQWYQKKYNVNDINQLTRDQLQESLANTKTALIFSSLIAGFGGVLFVVCKYLKPGMGEDPGWLEQLIGDDGMNKIGMGLGIGLFAGGGIATMVHLERNSKIKAALRSNYPPAAYLKISPLMVSVNKCQSLSPGVRFTFNF